MGSPLKEEKGVSVVSGLFDRRGERVFLTGNYADQFFLFFFHIHVGNTPIIDRKNQTITTALR